MDGAHSSLTWLLQDRWSGTSYTLSIGVPIIPTNVLGIPVATLAMGASGAYNHYFSRLGKTLVAAGEAGAYLRLGWEFDNGQFAWAATTPETEQSYAAYFQQIVTTMRAVRGEHFKFVWNADVEAFTSRSYNVGLAFPGRRFVAAIGIDDYDSQTWVSPSTPAKSWSQATLPDLIAARKFARKAGRPLAVSEWGLEPAGATGFGDDPLYMTNMIAWMKSPANDVVYESYFNDAETGLTSGIYPASLAALTRDL